MSGLITRAGIYRRSDQVLCLPTAQPACPRADTCRTEEAPPRQAAADLWAAPALISGDRDGEPCGHSDRLLMAPVERDAIGGLDEPAELAVGGRPKHPFQGELACNLCSAARSCVTQLWTRANHELDVLVDRERLLEEKISLPFGLTRAEQWRDARLDFKPVPDDRKLNRSRRPGAEGAVLDTAFPSGP